MDSSFSATQVGSLDQCGRLQGSVRRASIKVILVQSLFGFYKFVIGPAIQAIGGAGYGCRHTPTCSEYSREQFLKGPFLRASIRSMRRLLSCQTMFQTQKDSDS